MMPRIPAVVRFTVISAWLSVILLSPLPAVSLDPRTPPIDPFGSETLLSERDFYPVLSEEERQASDQLVVEFTTMGKGDPLYVWFGHAALVVTDLRNGRNVMYDYGIFSFNDDFYRTFVLGRLNYEVWATSASARYDLAAEEEREVHLMTLDLPAEAKLELVRFLNFNIQPENNTYLYHHYRANCSTWVRDIIDKAVGGQLRAWAESIPSDQTLRQHVMRHTSASPFMDWVLNFLQSGTVDGPITLWDAMFLPEVLEEALRQFTYTDPSGVQRKLVVASRTVLEEPPGRRPPVLTEWKSMTGEGFLVGLAIGLASLAFGRKTLQSSRKGVRRFNRIAYGLISWAWTFTVGVISALLLFMMTCSTHDVTYGNENIVFANPWLLVMSVQALGILFGKQRALVRFRKGNSVLAAAALILMLCKGVFPDLLVQQNWQILLTMLPIYICNSTIPFESIKRRRKIADDDD